MINDYRDETVSTQELFSSLKEVLPMSDILIRLDLIAALAANEQIRLDVLLAQVWSQFFPEFLFSEDIQKSCLAYYDEYRRGFKWMSKGELLQKPMTVLNVLVPTVTLLNLIKEGSTNVDLSLLESRTMEETGTLLKDAASAKSRIVTLNDMYFSESNVITEKTMSLLQSGQYSLKELAETLQQKLASTKGSRKDYPREKTLEHRDNEVKPAAKTMLCTPIKYNRIVILLYLALLYHNKTDNSRQKSIEASWEQAFGTTAISNEEYAQIDTIISKDDFLKSIDILFKYPIKEIRNGILLRQFATGLCVNLVISRMPHNSSRPAIADEAVSLFQSRFPTLSVGKDEHDINNYLTRFLTPDETVDDRVSALLWTQAEAISELFKIAVEDINSEESKRKRYWWEEVLDEKRQQVSTLRDQLDVTRANTIFNLIETLSGSTYDYLLSRLYRFAYEFDDFTIEEARTEVKSLIQVLYLYGVSPTAEKLIGKPVTDSACEDLRFSTAVINNSQPDYVVMPGWEVSGDTVIYPIVSKGTEEES